VERARQLDPMSPVTNLHVGLVLFAGRYYDQAIENFRKAIQLDPSFVPGHNWLGIAYEAKGMYEDAISEYQTSRALGDAWWYLALLGVAQAASGNKSEALKLLGELNELSKRSYVSPYSIAAIYAALGEKDQAFEWLEKAYKERSGGFVFIKVYPWFDSLRSDPRFQDLMRRVGPPTG